MKWYQDGDMGINSEDIGPMKSLPPFGYKLYRCYRGYNGTKTCVVCGLPPHHHGRTAAPKYERVCPGDDITDGVLTPALHNPVYGRAV